jgi:hypothetical protein
MDTPFFKANTKLPRGQYFYIQVGQKFYGGEVAETVEVKTDNRPVLTHSFEKGGRPSRALARRWAESGYNYPFRRGSSAARYARDVRKKTLAVYAQPMARIEPTITQQQTGYSSARLVDSQGEAKHYRVKKAVDSAAERLKAFYEGLDVKVTVRYEKGDSQ